MIWGSASGAGGPAEVTLGCQARGAGRAPWLPGWPGHTHRGIHRPRPQALLPARPPAHPQPQTERSVLGPESGLHRINCNNWQVGPLASGFRFSRGS